MRLYHLGHPDHLPAKPSKSAGRTSQGTNSASSPFCGTTLWGWKAPPWKHCQSSNKRTFPLQVVRGLLGRPHLMLGKYSGPAISFSQGGGHLWAALCGDESDIGIDVAGPDEFKREFQRDYPFHRVFHPQELQHALKLAGGDLEKASALLWSIKEAVVKALGCGFHLVDPRQITVYPSEEGAAGYAAAEDCGLYLFGGLIREGPGAVSHSCQTRPYGYVRFLRGRCGFPSPF